MPWCSAVVSPLLSPLLCSLSMSLSLDVIRQGSGRQRQEEGVPIGRRDPAAERGPGGEADQHGRQEDPQLGEGHRSERDGSCEGFMS